MPLPPLHSRPATTAEGALSEIQGRWLRAAHPPVKEHAMATPGIPAGIHTVTPSLVIRDAARAIDFYKKALGATENSRFAGPDGKIMHASIKIGDSTIYVTDENVQMGAKSPLTLNGTPVTLHLYVQDADTLFKKAVDAGCKITMPIADQFWGDRYGQVQDPFGHSWSIATQKEQLNPDQMKKRAEEFFATQSRR
jgi:uncharacterized glyoxalase superfamily protein PhnB